MLAVGGAMAVIPAIHAETVLHLHWLDDRTFTELMAISQLSPGPNVMLIPLIGWHVAGWGGALIALLAFLAPAGILAFFAGRLLRRHGEHPWLVFLRASLRPISAGLLIAAGIILVKTAAFAPIGTIITVVSATLAFARPRVNPLWWLGVAASVGIVLHEVRLQ